MTQPAEITYEPLCSVAYCPAPSDPDWHRCLICQRPDVDHQHTKGRGKRLTLDTRWVVPLCRTHHELIDTHQWTEGHIELPVDTPVRYYVVNQRGETVFEEALPWMQGVQREANNGDAPHGDVDGGGGGAAAVAQGVPAVPQVRSPAATDNGNQPPDSTDWRAESIAVLTDEDLAENFRTHLSLGGAHMMEAYRQVEAHRLKYAAVSGVSWHEVARQAFGVAPATADDYSRRWRAFEQALEQPEHLQFANELREMGGAVWRVIAHAPSDKWQAMVSVALSVVADLGVRPRLAAAVAARAKDEGVTDGPTYRYRCPDCGTVRERLADYKERIGG